MNKTDEFKFANRVQLGDKFFATHVWVGEGPIVLVTAVNGTGETYRSRLDMHKNIFIDPLPYEVSDSNVGALVKAINVIQADPGSP
jgi:hypothetical protein